MKSLSLTKPHLLIMVGLPGAGKTFFAHQFSETFNAPYLEYGVFERLTENEHQARDLWQYALLQLVLTKQTLLIEGCSSSRKDRHDLAAFARKHGYQPLFVWVQTEPATAELRATKGLAGKRPTKLRTQSDFTREAKQFEPLLKIEPFIVISGKHTYASQAKNVLKKLTLPKTSEQKSPAVPARDAQTVKLSGRITVQ